MVWIIVLFPPKTEKRLYQKWFWFFKNLQFKSTDTVKTPKSPEGDLKAAPLGEVWRGKIKLNLQFESSSYWILTFETASTKILTIKLLPESGPLILNSRNNETPFPQ